MLTQSNLNPIFISYLKDAILTKYPACLYCVSKRRKNLAATQKWHLQECRQKYLILNHWCLNSQELE